MPLRYGSTVWRIRSRIRQVFLIGSAMWVWVWLFTPEGESPHWFMGLGGLFVIGLAYWVIAKVFVAAEDPGLWSPA